MKYHALFVIFEEKQIKLKLSSAANYRWRFKVKHQFLKGISPHNYRMSFNYAALMDAN